MKFFDRFPDVVNMMTKLAILHFIDNLLYIL